MERERFSRMNDNGGEYLHSIKVQSSSPMRSVPVSPPQSAAVDSGLNYIIHTISKYDTLAGVAIKYGVEVADIKRLNGLVTDLQMFALKTIQIPLPGRHPPSPLISNRHQTPPRPRSSQQAVTSREHSNIFDSFSSLKLKSLSENKVSPAMSCLRGYYSLTPEDRKVVEMKVYQNGRAHYLEDGPFFKSSPICNPPLSHHRKSKSAANCLASENGEHSDQDSSQELDNNDSAKLVRRRQKSEADFTAGKLLKENSSSVSVSGKGLALRPKPGSRGADGELGGGFNPIPIGMGDSFLMDGVDQVQKSSSLQDSDSGSLTSLWSTSMWNLKPDFQALSAAAITMPIFDGLSKASDRRNKAALD